MNHRLRSLIWILTVSILLSGVSCALFGGTENSGRQDKQATPPPMPTIEGVAQDDLPIPLPPDAANFSSSQESFCYSTQLSAEEVAAFYQEALPPLGWTIKEQGNMAGTLMWTIMRQDVSYILNIMPSNGMTIVNVAPIK